MKGKKRIRSLAVWLFMTVMLVLNSITAMAAEKGSITLQLPAETAGMEITVYTVAELQDQGFVYCEEFKDCGITVEDMGDSQAAEEAAAGLAAYALQNKIEGKTAAVDETGYAVFSELDPALYLAVQTMGGEIIKMQAALISIPYTKSGASESTFDAVVSPKYSFPGGAVIVSKVNESGSLLADAVFSLQEKRYLTEGENPPAEAETESDDNGSFYWADLQTDLVTNENGQFAVTNLPTGTYRFTEVKAPAGYLLDETPVEFVIEKAGEVQQVEGKYSVIAGEVQELSIVNYPAAETPAPSVTPSPSVTPEAQTPTPGSSTPGSHSTSGGSSSGTPVKTGDDTPIGMYMVLLILAAGAIFIPIYLKMKEKRR